MQNEANFLLRNEAKFLTIAQAADFLKVSADTLRRWEEKGIVTPTRSKGGARRYTLLDLKLAKLKRKISHLSALSNLSNLRDLKIALFTSFLWILGLFAYHFLTPLLSLPTNSEERILSDQLKGPARNALSNAMAGGQTNLKMASETTQIKTNAIKISIKPDPDETSLRKAVEASLESDLLIRPLQPLSEANRFTDTPASTAQRPPSREAGDEPTLRYTDSTGQYYSLQPLPKNQSPTIIKRI